MVLFNIDVALNLDEAGAFYNNQSYMSKCDLVFLDVQLPVGSDKSLLSGEDMGLKIREKYPETKVAILYKKSEILMSLQRFILWKGHFNFLIKMMDKSFHGSKGEWNPWYRKFLFKNHCLFLYSVRS